MAIDKAEFSAGMGVLAGAFNRSLDAAVTRSYYRLLSDRLTTDEFQRAVEITLATETFWPSPAVLLAKIKADDESRAVLAFEHVNRVMISHGGYRFLTAETYNREFDAPTKAAISAVGGLAAIGNTNEDRWQSLQRKFVKEYNDSQRPALPAPQTDPRVKQLVRNTALSLVSGRDKAAGRDE